MTSINDYGNIAYSESDRVHVFGSLGRKSIKSIGLGTLAITVFYTDGTSEMFPRKAER